MVVSGLGSLVTHLICFVTSVFRSLPLYQNKWLPGYDLMIAPQANSGNPFGLDSVSLSHLNSQILLYERMMRRSAMMTLLCVSVGVEESVSL